MKREVRLLLEQACDSILVSIEFFNRPTDRGRVSSTLIMLDHALEMLLKAALVHRGESIRGRLDKQNIGFDACVGRGLSSGDAKFLTQEEALLLQSIHGLRDAAQHDLLGISEGQLYMQVQAGVTAFRDILKDVFGQELADKWPDRVLPVSTSPPASLTALFDSEAEQVRALLRPGRRRTLEAETKLRPLAILDAALRGEKGLPNKRELRHIGKDLAEGKGWQAVFKGVSAIEITADPTVSALSLRLTKKEGIAIQIVAEGTPNASVVAVRRVDELAFYNMGAKQLADKMGLSTPKLLAVVEAFGIRRDPDCYKEIRIGKSLFKRYSQKAIGVVQEALRGRSVDQIWAQYCVRREHEKHG